MRQLITFAHEAEARTFGDHLLTLGITTQINAEVGGWAMWVRDEDRMGQAQAELEIFQREPGHPRYRRAGAGAELVRKQEAEAERQYQRRVIDARSLWNRPAPQKCVVTVTLIVISVAVTILTHFGEIESSWRQRLSYARYVIGSEPPENNQTPEQNLEQWKPRRLPDGDIIWLPRSKIHTIKSGEIWRLVTPIFLHFNFMHILFNMMFLYDVGGRIEMFRGRWRFVLLVLISAVLSNFAQNLVSEPLFGGMSGVDYALFGYAWLKTRYDPTPGLFLPPETILMGLIWLVVCMTPLVGNIANTAHFVGLSVGVVAGGAWPLFRWLQKRWRRR
jgi:GlpG protein